MAYKIALVGPANSGKSTFVHYHLDGSYLDTHTPTIGVEVTTLDFPDIPKTINVWDISGTKKYQGLLDGYLLATDFTFIIVSGFDFEGCKEYIQKLKENNITENIYIIFNKIDTLTREEIQKGSEKAKELGYSFIPMSCRNRIGVNKPFRYLAQ
jgi:small GTP-binding protein